jgi:molecular chaperone GrpE (heat shock protein)
MARAGTCREPSVMNNREAEEAAIPAFIAAGLVKKLPPVLDSVERAIELQKERAAKGADLTFRRSRGRPRKSR